MPTPGHSSSMGLRLPTELGEFVVSYSEHGLAELRFPSDQRAEFTGPVVTLSPQVREWQRVTADAVNETLAGRQPKRFPPLDLSVGTEFQQCVWRALMKIPRGRTSSYGEIARAIGRPKAVRAVGGACGANPIPVLVPCHRVLAANHQLGGFSGGLDWKRTLLAREGVSLS